MAKKKTSQEFNRELQELYPHLILVSDYTTNNNSVDVKCIKHNLVFSKIASSLLRKNRVSQCPKCMREVRPTPYNKLSSKDYDFKLNQLDTSLARLGDYIDINTSIEHICAQGHKSFIIPSNALKGTGCNRCARDKLKLTDEEYFNRILIKKYDLVPIAKYKNFDTKILHECLKCSNKWLAKPKNILAGKGCPRCRVHGFNENIPAYLYYIKIITEQNTVYKIGVTRKENILDRFASDKDKTISVLYKKYFQKGKDAINMERQILKEFSSYLIDNQKILNSGGNTEIFSYDVLQYDEN